MSEPYRDRMSHDLSAAYDDAVGDVYWEDDPQPRQEVEHEGAWAGEAWSEETWAEEPTDEAPTDEETGGDEAAWDEAEWDDEAEWGDEAEWEEDQEWSQEGEWGDEWEDDEPPSRRGLWVKLGVGAVAALLLVAVLVAGMVILTRTGGHDGADGLALQDQRSAVPAQLPHTGAYVESRILESGVIDVDQWIRSPDPIRRLTLRAPGAAAAPDAASTPEASDVVLASVGGGRLPAPSVVGTVPQVVSVQPPTRTVHLTYRLEGVVDTNSGSVTGRALARATSLDVDYAPVSGPIRVAVVGSGVLNLSCSARAPMLLLEPCGTPHGNGWQVLLTGARRSDRVTAQLNLGYFASADGASGQVVRGVVAAAPGRTR